MSAVTATGEGVGPARGGTPADPAQEPVDGLSWLARFAGKFGPSMSFPEWGRYTWYHDDPLADPERLPSSDLSSP